MANQKITNTPYDNVFRTLLNNCTPLIISVINDVFGEQYSMYYDNAEKEGGISSYEILNGLNRILENGVEYVGISLSSKYYLNELQQWITAHYDEITVFASYNNTINTLDYPANYENLKGIYSSFYVKAKSIDIFLSNNIILISDGIHFYRGNSY